MLIGIRSSAVKETPFSQGKLELINNAGFDGVELSFNYEPKELDWQTGFNAKALRAQADKLNLRFVAHGPDHLNLAHPDKSLVEKHVEELKSMLAGISQYGAETVTFHVEGSSYEPFDSQLYSTQMNHLIHALQSVESTCQKCNIKLLIETMTPGHRLTADFNNILTILNAVQSPCFGICLDTNHLNLSMDLGKAILKAGNNLIQFHCSDNYGQKEEHRMIGDGIIDWDQVANAAAEINFDGNIILETNTYDATKYDSLLEAASVAAHSLAEKIRALSIASR